MDIILLKFSFFPNICILYLSYRRDIVRGYSVLNYTAVQQYAYSTCLIMGRIFFFTNFLNCEFMHFYKII